MRYLEREEIERAIRDLAQVLEGKAGVPRPDLVLAEALDPEAEVLGLVEVAYITWFRFCVAVKATLESERVDPATKNRVHHVYKRLLDSLI